MKLKRPYWHHPSDCRIQLIQLQLTTIARPLPGGIGFLLVVPAIGFALVFFRIMPLVNLDLLKETPDEDDALCKALKQAAADLAFALPAQLDTIIFDDGFTLSVGERKSLELAHALLEQRPVMILDETTSNLDPENEARVITTLQSLKHNRLIIIISHRAAVADAADLTITINDISGDNVSTTPVSASNVSINNELKGK